MFTKVLVANRGEIACRIIRTLREMGIISVAVYSEADAHCQHVLDADEAYLLGPAAPSASYLDGEKILALAQECGAQAIHPGYGFLSENTGFCQKCEDRGIRFIGPTATQMLDFGLKHRARGLAEHYKVPLLPGSSLLTSQEDALKEAQRIGYPVMLKSSAGGGGIGMELCFSAEEIQKAYERIRRLSENNFNDAGLFVEKYIEQARHIEVQIFGDGKGNALILGDRDCSVQRRNQKVIEETPAPHVSKAMRDDLYSAAKRLVEGVRYRSAGTVEFVYDAAEKQFYFLEVNTRLQVEHCVTEAIFDVDLVQWMVLLAAEELPELASFTLAPQGAAIEVRIYAEDPGKSYQPSTGILTEVVFPENVRLDTWIKRGSEISSYYDPLLAKLIVHAPSRAEAILALQSALALSALGGLETNLILLRQIAEFPAFTEGIYTTRILDTLVYMAPTILVDVAGMQTTLQDYPGRLGYWAVGVPPSGPMDSLNHRLANRIVGNSEEAATLEITIKGPELTFNTPAIIALSGADISATVDGVAVDRYKPLPIEAGSVLKTGTASHGQRAYLSVRGGIDVPLYMGSRSTFTLGQFGGHAGRSLRAGDVLRIGTAFESEPRSLAEEDIPGLPQIWEIGVLYGPHGAPDFFTTKDIETFFATKWEVHYNSSRTGVRLLGPGPQWARTDGGEAGLHPSNIHDNAYAIGAIDYTGDMPVILGPDGPSLGGFVCPATIVQAELWKMGQLRAGDRVRFIRLSQSAAEQLETGQENFINTLAGDHKEATFDLSGAAQEPAIVKTLAIDGNKEEVVYRRAGDKYLLIEYGELVLDLRLRFRVHALMLHLEQLDPPGIIDITPGIRSLQIHYDNRILPLADLLTLLEHVEREIAGYENKDVPARIVHLPLSWDDVSTHTAIEKYMQSVRPDAPWCPSNIEFIRRINGLESVEEVQKIVFNASYLVMGLGDVYLGAPVATPMDPRHRLVTTKYNPARTWTPENAVGIGGAYLCVYGMEGPGGYQFVGRTVQMWNRYNSTPEFEPGKPWLLRFFDQIRFYPVSHEELKRLRRDFPHGGAGLQIEETTFNLQAYEQFLQENSESISCFKEQQQKSFELERQEWLEKGHLNFHSEEPVAPIQDGEIKIIQGCEAVLSPVSGSLWKLLVETEKAVTEGDTLAVIECMKMEFNVKAPCSGIVKQVLCVEGGRVSSGQHLVSISPLNRKRI
ncbi:MAG: urea carboxylase [Proteobacteria bacterium]|nr:urea carboxylase [Pseudomonadota bacterium]